MGAAIPLYWEGDALPYHIDTVETAHRNYNFIAQSLQQIDVTPGVESAVVSATLAPLANGGAMAVYTLTAEMASGQPIPLICKIPHERQLVYTPSTSDATIETTQQLLEQLAQLAQRLHLRAPGLFPRNGGVWHWQTDAGEARHLLVEEFIPGLSVERLILASEQQWTDGHISETEYRQQRLSLERLAIATFTQLWVALDHQLFTSDPSPWNLLVHPQRQAAEPRVATIIDLHSLEENAGLAYVIQRLAALYGLRQDLIDGALLPGIFDVLGPDEGRTLLLAELPQLEAEAEQAAKNLGVNLQQPLLKAIRAL